MENGKKLITAAGTRSWCFVTHSGVSRPSGNVGEPGVNGEIGECRVEALDPERLTSESVMEVSGDDSFGRSALRGGS